MYQSRPNRASSSDSTSTRRVNRRTGRRQELRSFIGAAPGRAVRTSSGDQRNDEGGQEHIVEDHGWQLVRERRHDGWSPQRTSAATTALPMTAAADAAATTASGASAVRSISPRDEAAGVADQAEDERLAPDAAGRRGREVGEQPGQKPMTSR